MNKFIAFSTSMILAICADSWAKPRFAIATLSEIAATTASEVAKKPSTSYQPLPDATCNRLAQEMTKVLKVRVTIAQAVFQDFVSTEQGTGCQLIATGNGRNFTTVSAVIRNLSAMLTKQGWKEASNYAADGPTGSVRAFRLVNSLALLDVEWEPTQDAKCPKNRPISDCKLSVDQQIYRITLNAARK